MTRIIFLLLIGCTIFGQAYAQPTVRHFSTQKVNKRIETETPLVRQNRRQIERFVHQQRRRIGGLRPKTIPFVVHIVFNDPREIPALEQLFSQFMASSVHFWKPTVTYDHPANEKEGFMSRRPDSTGIQFCLAKVVRGRDTLFGVNYVQTSVEEWTDDDAIKSSRTGGADPWNPDRFGNLWIGHLADSIAGYAQMPGGPKATDGIVMDYRYVGTQGTVQAPYDEGKTLTHLIGSYLGLHELWGNGRCEDDYVADTPVHNSPNHGCPGYQHISLCFDNPVEMTMNFMDNTDDACMYMFTRGQVKRMQTMLAPGGPRHSLTVGPARCTTEEDVRNYLAGRSEPVPVMPEQDDIPVTVRLQPNPTTGKTTVIVEGIEREKAQLTVHSINGRVMLQRSYSVSDQITLDGSDWQPGIYFIQLRTDSWTQTVPLVITQ